MKLIQFEDIVQLQIPPEQFYSWVEDMLTQKDSAILPPKISMKQVENGFCNVMPCVLPCLDTMGVKIVTRSPSHIPAISSQIILYSQSTGEPIALMDGTYITALRTGAVAAHSISVFSKKNLNTIGFIGLGNTARATLQVFASAHKDKQYHIKLLRYKDQAESFINRFKKCENLSFSICDKIEDVVESSDVTVSCVTYADKPLVGDSYFTPGCTVIPVHTRGFQNCDLFFDKVFADDLGHVKGFQYFSKFKSFAETCDVLTGKCEGRVTDEERILVYNIGIAIHDIFFAYKIYSMFDTLPDKINLSTNHIEKFWV